MLTLGLKQLFWSELLLLVKSLEMFKLMTFQEFQKYIFMSKQYLFVVFKTVVVMQ